MSRTESTPVRTFHIYRHKDKYAVFSPELVKKGCFNTKKDAIAYIDSINFLRYPIFVQKENGILEECIYSTKTRKLSVTDNGKPKKESKRKGYKALYAR